MIALVKPKSGRWSDVWPDLCQLADSPTGVVDIDVALGPNGEGWIEVYPKVDVTRAL
jgi:hypothetical protein